MGSSDTRGAGRDEVLAQVIASYLEAVDQGSAPPRDELLALHPELAAELREFFAGQDDMGHLAGATRTAEDRPSPLRGKRTIGDHEILGEIARGGMGVVYRARERKLGREVALKAILSGSLASREERERFLREARAAAGLDHPGIVPIYEVGEEDGLHYFTMKLIEGGSLAAWDPPGGRAPRRAAEVMESVARAVHHAHERGILHRDLKPANILLDGRGAPLVSDFGLARPLDRESSLTASGALVGTASYMAPEQAFDSRGATRRTADIYSLGAILYELLTGAPPFRGATAVETLRQAKAEEPRRPSHWNDSVPQDLETICLKCIEKRPEQRYATALGLADDLRRFLAGEPIAARAVSRVERASRWARRHPARSLSALFLVAAALGSTLGALLLLGERAETRLNLAAARLSQARAGALSRRPGQRLEGLRAVREAAAIRPSLELRNAAISCLSLVDLEIQRRFATGGPNVAALALDSTLERAVTASWDGEVRVRELASGRELARSKESPSRTVFVRFSPDDRMVLRCTSSDQQEGGIIVWRLEGKNEVVLNLPAGISCAVPGFGAGSRTVAFVDSEGFLKEVEIATGAILRRISVGKRAVRVEPDPSGSRASVQTTDGRAMVFDLEKEKSILDVPGDWISPCHPSLDLVAVCRVAEIDLWSIAGRNKLRTLKGHEGQVLQLEFSPFGEILASTSWDGTTRLWSISGREILRYDAEGSIHFGRDARGVGIVYTDRSVAVGELTLAAEARTLAVSATAPRAIEFAPDERWIAHGLHEGVRVLDLPAGRELVPPAPGANCVIVAAGGETLFTTGSQGLLRWPMSEESAAAETAVAARLLKIGPPQPLPRALRAANGSVSLSADGKRLLTGYGLHRLVVLDISGAPSIVREFHLTNAVNVALSPDGALAAAGPLHGTEACVWDVESGAAVRRFPHPSSVMSAFVGFSPDGRWFYLSSTLECSLFRTGDWDRPLWILRRAQPLGYATPFSFSRDGALLAMTLAKKAIRIVHTATGAEVATLEEPDSSNHVSLRWSPSGRWIAAGLENGELKLWDLLAVRRGLRRAGLDWDGPPEVREAPPVDPRPLRIEVDLGPAARKKR